MPKDCMTQEVLSLRSTYLTTFSSSQKCLLQINQHVFGVLQTVEWRVTCHNWARVFIKWTRTWPDSSLVTMVWGIPKGKANLEEELITEASLSSATPAQRNSLAVINLKDLDFLLWDRTIFNFHLYFSLNSLEGHIFLAGLCRTSFFTVNPSARQVSLSHCSSLFYRA